MKKLYVLSILFIFLTSTTFAGTVNLPKTGQTKCYDTAGVEIPCAGTGQDGDIQAGVPWPEPRLTDNYDGTMTDNLTGLMWTKDANIPNGTMDWYTALDFCNNLNLAGYSDWRLPNVNEMESLVNGAESNTATWLNTQGFTNVQEDFYWSSTTCANYPDDAWVVDMRDGDVYNGPKSYGDNCVWPVRSGQTGSLENSVISLPQTGQTKCYDTSGIEIPCAGTGQDGDIQAGTDWPSPRFVDYGNGTVTDDLAGLMWTKNANLPGDVKTWQQALDYVKGMNQNTYPNFGYTDWRLPNRKELYSLTDFSRYNPALPSGHPFTNVLGGYWSSTTYAYNPDSACVVDIWGGFVSNCSKYSCYGYMWPVRGGQVEPTGCSTWSNVIGKYNAYVSGQATWNDVMNCYNQYASP